MKISKDTGVKVLMTFFSFGCAEVETCRNMIADPNKNVPFINNALKPILDHINNNGYNDRVFAFEMFNEPEYMIVDSLEEGLLGSSNKIALDRV